MAMFAHRSLDGPAAVVDRAARPLPLSPRQVRARRNHLWLFAVEVGLPLRHGGPAVRQTAGQLAQLFGVSRQAVQAGLADARSTRAEVGHAVHP